MIYTEDTILNELIIHKVGNKVNNEELILSDNIILPNEGIRNLLQFYFLQPFKSEEYFNLSHESDLNLNEVYAYASRIFEDKNSFLENSKNLAKHLYESSNHPNIKPGEFYTVLFDNIIIEGIDVDAIGLFKSESKDVFLKVYSQGNSFSINSESGININKLDKGCIIFNLEKERGYLVAVVDNTNKNSEAHFWLDDFLHVSRRKDDYYQTENIIDMYKEFVNIELQENFNIPVPEKTQLLNNSIQYLKEKENFDINEFSNAVIRKPEHKAAFRDYTQKYCETKEIEPVNNFQISNSAVKKQSKFLKSVLKLDKNFTVYVHGGADFMNKGFDDRKGMHYYQFFYNSEK